MTNRWRYLFQSLVYSKELSVEKKNFLKTIRIQKKARKDTYFTKYLIKKDIHGRLNGNGRLSNDSLF
jgi:hypothetical protein